MPAADPPDPSIVFKAVDAYVRAAYDDKQPPTAVRSMLATLHGWQGKFYACPVFVNDGATPPNKYSMRLGNRHYPHMKLVIERAPDGQSFLFRADTHDRHVCPPSGAPEHEEFTALMSNNQQCAQAVEAAWAELGDVPTFKTWLRDDLTRRQG